MSSTTVNSENIATLLERTKPRAGPLIITLFGDSLAPRGTDIWLGNLIDLLAPFNISERQVRTGVFRLAKEGWLTAQARGRRSYYALSDQGRKSFQEADARIYAPKGPVWDDKWLIVQIPNDWIAAERKKLRDCLSWNGFGQLGPTTFIKPGGETTDISKATTAIGLKDKPFIFCARRHEASHALTIAATAWNLDAFKKSYQDLMNDFAFAEQWLMDAGDDGGKTAFFIRTLLIHQYRRTLLKDPFLPDQLLPKNWPGRKARTRVSQLYARLTPPTDSFLARTIESSQPKCPKPGAQYYRRFTNLNNEPNNLPPNR